ncbi:forkhead box protein N1 [Lampris incognitus]|uniref:forkhead box protein N1 n=1 Tax=Lampris incognitus TaxID=2546036 RepID=UPI0024B57CCB|nr:forkhead box protein N1 [Lampris incognitus]
MANKKGSEPILDPCFDSSHAPILVQNATLFQSPRSHPSPPAATIFIQQPQANLDTCEPLGTSYQQMAESQKRECNEDYFSQRESATFRVRTVALDRRHSADETISSGSGPGQEQSKSYHFHPYRRQFSDGVVKVTDCQQNFPPSYTCLQDGASPDTHSSSSEAPASWDQYNGGLQASRLTSSQNTYSELPAAPLEPSCFLSESHTSSSSLGPLQQFSSNVNSSSGQSNNNQYSLQCLSPLSHQENTTQTIFPKPIYSYSILIFMALRNSRTGSLPVSEIYRFMTEHFPYFKTAPDGWKNSVRHNLSLNKCFEKVENKSGNSSRKGCLWALNPAKVEKMQEELHKWRRKDPVSVRKSMARPEDLDQLLGEGPEKLRSLPVNRNPGSVSRLVRPCNTATLSFNPTQTQESPLPIQHSHYSHIATLTQEPYYHPPTVHHPSNSFPFHLPCRQPPLSDVPSTMGDLNSPMAEKAPPAYRSVQETEYNVGPKNIHEFLFEGDGGYDVDTLNPSLTDLQLQGNLWEELREDSLVSDSLAVITTNPSTTSPLSSPHIQSSGLQAMASFIQTSEEGAQNMCSGSRPDQRPNGFYPMVYSGVESFAGYLTSCTTTVSLL